MFYIVKVVHFNANFLLQSTLYPVLKLRYFACVSQQLIDINFVFVFHSFFLILLPIFNDY